MNIKWTDKITNDELWRNTQQKPTENHIKRRKWNWIGHKLRKEVGVIEKTASDWNSHGYRRRGRPKRTWRRTIEDERRGTGIWRNEVKGIVRDRNAWKLFMDDLCSTRRKRPWWWWWWRRRLQQVSEWQRNRRGYIPSLRPFITEWLTSMNLWHIPVDYKCAEPWYALPEYGTVMPKHVEVTAISCTGSIFSCYINPLNVELNPICHLLALLGGATIVVVSRLRVKWKYP